MNNQKDMPVFLFTGFLESGKTKFIQDTLEDKRFCNGEKTLLLVCEEGEEEYAPEQFAAPKSVYIRVVEEIDELTSENLAKWANTAKAERVVIEYNGMWLLDNLYAAMPEGWMVYQEFCFADAGTFLTYNSNMRNLVYDKLKSCELVVFNRFETRSMDKMEFHKIVRGANRRADIAYEGPNNQVVYDDIEDPLPFDINAPVIEIGDDDYAEWYRDLGEEPKKYFDKVVKFKCRTFRGKHEIEGSFFVGRHVMTCCIEDIQPACLICKWEKAQTLKEETWMILTAKIEFRFSKAYGRKGPVLVLQDMELCDAPEQPVAQFY